MNSARLRPIRRLLLACLVVIGCFPESFAGLAGFMSGDWEGAAGSETLIRFRVEHATIQSVIVTPAPLSGTWVCGNGPPLLAGVNVPVQRDSFAVTLTTPTVVASLTGAFVQQPTGIFQATGRLVLSGSACVADTLRTNVSLIASPAATLR